MNKILQEYFDGVVKQIQTEVDSLKKVVKHPVKKGEGSEKVLTDFLKKFLPKKYSVGSGFVIDSEGNRSFQCDIIIYDSYKNPELIHQTSTRMFPVESVYAVIQIKMNLRRKDITDAVKNIESVKKLKPKKQFISFWAADESHSVKPMVHRTYEPFGFIFAYTTDIVKLETLEKNFNKDLSKIAPRDHFQIAYIMDRSIMVAQPDFYIHKEFVRDKPVAVSFYGEIEGKKVNFDISRGFLNFLVLMYELLNKKMVAPVDIKDYLPENFPELKVLKKKVNS